MRQIHASGRSVAISVILLFGLTIVISMITGQWQTESSKVPATIESGDFAGEFDPGDIRGSYTFTDIEKNFGIPVSQLAEAYAFAVNGDPGAVQPKMFEEFPQPADGEIGTDSIRLFVSLYNGIPYEPEADTKLPNSALALLKREGRIDDAEWTELKEKYGVAMDEAGTAVADRSEAGEESAALEIKGRTTYGDLYDAGISRETVRQIIGIEPGKEGETVRDHLAAAGLEFSDYKTQLQEAADKAAAGE